MKIIVDNITINYTECGRPQGTPVVFIHGFPFSHKMWEPQMSVLSDDIRAILYDVRGHGSSGVGDGLYTIELFVDDLIALLDHLAIEKAILCGLSMGGYIALRAFERNPDRISGLILCDTKSEPDTNDAKIKRTTTMKMIQSAGVRTFTEDFVKAIFWEKTFEQNRSTINFIQELIQANSPIGICGTLLALASRTDTTPVLSTINVPTCIIVGEHDKLTPVSVAQTMHKTISGSELHLLPSAGHMSNLENTKDFNEKFASFLKKHW
jgi:3-oxoadipate enol-lactonase